MRRNTITISLCLGLAALLLSIQISRVSHAAGPWYVSPGGDDILNDCQSAGAPCATINGAIAKASAGDPIYVAVGTYTSTENEVVLIDKDIMLSGGWNASFGAQDGMSTVNGEKSRRGITVSSNVTATVEHFVAQDGSGNGVYNEGTLTMNDSLITGGLSTSFSNGGGGIYNYRGVLTLNRCTVRDNRAGNSGSGGGIFNYAGIVTLNDCTVSNNAADENGGGIHDFGTMSLNNSTISGNTSDGTGGGINHANFTIILSNCTVAHNLARAAGGIQRSGGTATMQNTILADNLGGGSPDCNQVDVSLGFNLIGDTTGCTFSPATGDLTGVDAGLGQLIGAPGEPSYHPLLSSSPAIDAGNPAGCTDHVGSPLDVDQRGAARVGRCDIGAYEYTSPGPAASIHALTGTPQRTPPFTVFGVPFQTLVLDSVGSPVSLGTVTFTAPSSGVSGTFADSGTFTTTATTDASGMATAAPFTANGLTGTYTVTAAVNGVVTPANYLSGNIGWYVTLDGDDANDCQTSMTPCATINGPLAKAGFVPGDTVLVASGTYTSTGDQVVLIDKSVRLWGGWDSTFATQNGVSTIDGEESRRGISVNSSVTAIVERFVIQSGLVDWVLGEGGGIHNSGHLTLNTSTVRDSAATGSFVDGGGIHNNGTLVLNGSHVDNNVSGSGGGIRNAGTLTLNSSTVSDNSGGGIYSNDGVITLDNSTISGNQGGGIRSSGGMLILNDSTISSNTAHSGGGIHCNGCTAILNNSTVSQNAADNAGGGIDGTTASTTLQNSIIAGNTAHSAPDCSGSFMSLGYNVIGDVSGCSFTPAMGDLTDVDAGLGQLIGAPTTPKYHPLWPGSPAVDAGNPAGCTDHVGNPLNTDQRGASRVGRCDIGAYEYTTPGPAASIYTLSGTPQRTPPSFAFPMPLQALVLDSIGSPVNNATVSLMAPASGASGTFADSGTYTTTAVTDEGGIASAATFTANELTGSYTVTAMVGGVVTPANYLLGNISWYVRPDGDNGNDCQTPTMPCATINGVLGKADFVAGDTVLVASGTYTGTGEEVALLDKSVRLLGGWDGTFAAQSGVSSIDGEGVRRGMTVSSDVVATVEWVVIQNGSADNGSGISIWDYGTLTLSSSSVNGNASDGIYSLGILMVNDCVVTDNSGTGVHNRGTLTVNNCVINGNTGGINNYRGLATVNNSTISSNVIDGSGGGIGNRGILIVNNSGISGNMAIGSPSNNPSGGGVSNRGTMVLNNCTVSNNTSWRGGGIHGGGATTLNSCTISGNTADYGGGVYGQVTLQNSILAGNTSLENDHVDCDGSVDTLGYNLIGNPTGCSFTPGEGDLVNVGPGLDLFAEHLGCYPLVLASPAIDAGNPGGCTDHLGNPLLTDQRGFPRFRRCDIGAYEMQPIGFSTKVSSESVVALGEQLTYTIVLTNGGVTDITGVFATDALPISVDYVSDSLAATGGSYGYDSQVITWTGKVTSGTAVTITFGATARQVLGPITNSAVISGGGEIITRSAVVDIADLQVTKRASSDTVQAGEQLTYTIRVTNTGNVDLHATITDTLPNHVTPGGVRVWSPTIPAPGGVWERTFVATVEMGYAGPLTNVVQVTTEEGATGGYTEISESRVTPMLEVSKSASADTVQAGEQLTYTIRITNTGNVDLHGTVTDVLPGYVTSSGPLVWTPTIPAPGGVWERTFVVTVEMGYAGPLTNVVHVTTDEGAAGTHTETTESQVTPVLEVTKRASAETVQAGEQLTYTIRVTNSGNVDLHATVTDVLPSHATASGPLVWTPTIAAPDGIWEQTLVVTVEAGYSGPLTNNVQVTTEEGASGSDSETCTSIGGYYVYLPIVMRGYPQP